MAKQGLIKETGARQDKGSTEQLIAAVSFPVELPVSQAVDEIVAALNENQVVLVVGETGSGKTTQLPKICLRAGFGTKGKIALTQPRRVAAFAASRRISEELETHWGGLVGCKVRFHDHTRPETVIKVMTDGILLAEIQQDRLLRAYEVIIIDEAHERSLSIDFLLGYFRNLLPQRPDLRVVITSATLDSGQLAMAFPSAKVVEVGGRVYPVAVRYAPPGDEDSLLDAVLQAVREAVVAHATGDILVFMATERDILELVDCLRGGFQGRDVEVLGLYGRLSSARQQEIISGGVRRRVIVSTNIAETSLTIPNITVVIDSGLARMSRYNPRSRIASIPVEAISQSSALQRAGRAGRVQPGECVRVYSEESFLQRDEYTQPEILRSNLAEVVLRMKVLDLGSAREFPFIESPSSSLFTSAERLLFELGAIDERHELTKKGRLLAGLGMDPVIGAVIYQSFQEGCLPEVLVVAAALSVQDPRDRPVEQQTQADQKHAEFRHARSDFLTLRNIWVRYSACRSGSERKRFCKQYFLSFRRMQEWRDTIDLLERNLKEDRFLRQLGGHAKLLHNTGDPGSPLQQDEESLYRAIHRCILAGCLAHVAFEAQPGVWQGAGNRRSTIFPGSTLAKRLRSDTRKRSRKKNSATRWLVAFELVQSSRLFTRTNALVDPLWIADLGSHLCKVSYLDPHYCDKQQAVIATKVVRLQGLELQRVRVSYGSVSKTDAVRIFLSEVVVPAVAQERALSSQVSGEVRRWLDDASKEFGGIARACAVTRSVTYDELSAKLQSGLECSSLQVCSVTEFNKWYRLAKEKKTATSLVQLSGLTKNLSLPVAEGDQAAVILKGEKLPLTVRYQPGASDDGCSVSVPVHLLPLLSVEDVFSAIRINRPAVLTALLKALPGKVRSSIGLVAELVDELIGLCRHSDSFYVVVLRQLHKRYPKIDLPQYWNFQALPDYLIPNIQVTGTNGALMAQGRVTEILAGAAREIHQDESTRWRARVSSYDKPVSLKSLGEIGEVSAVGGGLTIDSESVRGFYGLVSRADGEVCFGLYPTSIEAERSLTENVRLLAMAWIKSDLAEVMQQVKVLKQPQVLHPLWRSIEEAKLELVTALVRFELERAELSPLSSYHWDAISSRVKASIRQKAPSIVSGFQRALDQRARILQKAGREKTIVSECEFLFPSHLLIDCSQEELERLPQYMQALEVRLSRLHSKPEREMQLWNTIANYHSTTAERLSKVEDRVRLTDARRQLRLMLCELYISFFAQEIKTVFPVSVKRVDTYLRDVFG